jgi:hypothetical protein
MHEVGVRFLLSNKPRDALVRCKPVSSRIMVACFQAQPFNLSIVQVYTPAAGSQKEDTDTFYNDLQQT